LLFLLFYLAVFNLKILKIKYEKYNSVFYLYGSEIRLIMDEELEYLRLKAERVNC
jgi:hypothetical protein